jgi:hypothetical protein
MLGTLPVRSNHEPPSIGVKTAAEVPAKAVCKAPGAFRIETLVAGRSALPAGGEDERQGEHRQSPDPAERDQDRHEDLPIGHGLTAAQFV